MFVLVKESTQTVFAICEDLAYLWDKGFRRKTDDEAVALNGEVYELYRVTPDGFNAAFLGCEVATIKKSDREFVAFYADAGEDN